MFPLSWLASVYNKDVCECKKIHVRGQLDITTKVPKLQCISIPKEAFVKGQFQKICFVLEDSWGAVVVKLWDFKFVKILLLVLKGKKHEIGSKIFQEIYKTILFIFLYNVVNNLMNVGVVYKSDSDCLGMYLD